jgi:hypothetical protein
MKLVPQATINSLQIHNATNSLPNVAASTVFCHSKTILLVHSVQIERENHIFGAFCTNRKIPLCEHLITIFPAWLASTKAEIVTGCPCSLGMLGGNSSSSP